MPNYLRSHHCGELRIDHLDQKVSLSGWVHRRRDHGGLIFIDLRDHNGLTQLVFDPKDNLECHKKAHQLRSEWVITIKGVVIPRTEGMANPNMDTGAIEIEVEELDILSEADTPPFSICEEVEEVKEDLRLKYRYLDMRRGKLQRNLHMRHQVMLEVRNYLSQSGFFEVSTPILCKATPEGARDYLVPSRIYPGSFYALPQSPQIFKQLLMIGGLDKYFQICPCFRDEDLRSDRQPEFSQIDIEMSFEHIETLFKLTEKMFSSLYKKCLQKDLETPFQRLTYQQCLDDYGTDKPDLRIPMRLHNLNDIAQKSTFSIFLQALENDNTIKAMKVPQGSDISRRMIDQYTNFVAQFGVKGLAWFKVQENKLQSSIAKFFDDTLQQEIIKRCDLKDGDLLFIVADKKNVTNQALDHLRRHIAKERNLIDTSKDAFLWVTDFPLFEHDDNLELQSSHHPFTAPHPDDVHLLDTEPVKVRSQSYDLVLNGYEIASGSQRIHNPKTQEKIFSLLRLTPEEIQVKFGFFVKALTYGTPPHLGIALGLDRMMMIFLNTENIRDVVAFPKTQKASDLMLEAPAKVGEEQLRELKIDIDSKEIL
ncbi:MAG: Aspartate--tRNA(Asp/Asn) ligase [Chlamydiae bacterium]|nr:Aspartate--tRNA(Asp/Asn) ligase [Chlamydiota bacterium]